MSIIISHSSEIILYTTITSLKHHSSYYLEGPWLRRYRDNLQTYRSLRDTSFINSKFISFLECGGSSVGHMSQVQPTIMHADFIVPVYQAQAEHIVFAVPLSYIILQHLSVDQRCKLYHHIHSTQCYRRVERRCQEGSIVEIIW